MSGAKHKPGQSIYADPKAPHQELTAEQQAILDGVPEIEERGRWVKYAGRYFPTHLAAALQLRYEARLRAANAKNVKRFGDMRCDQMRREAVEMYAGARAARAAIAKATGGAA